MKKLIRTFLYFLAGTLSASPTLSLDAVGAHGAVYTNRQTPEFLRKETLPGKQWKLQNWRKKTIASGEWRSSGTLKLSPLPCGYYYLTIPSENPARKSLVYPFAVVKDRSARIINPESAYAIDSVISWCAAADKRNPFAREPQFELAANLLALGGFSWARDRYSWRWTERSPEPGKQNSAVYDGNGQRLKKRGIRRLNVFHDSPEWTRRENKKLPEDLLALYRFTRKMAESGCSDAWEFWNESDIGFSNEPAWEFAAAQKAAYLGFKAGKPDLPVLLGSFCNNPPGAYAETVLQNGIAGYFDIFNYHTYTNLEDLPFLLRNIHALLKRHNLDDRVIWFTENGTYAEGPAKNNGVCPGMKAHSPEQEMTVAESIPKSQILLQSLGVARIFFFQLCPFNEQNGNKDWGLLRRDFTVKPGFSAISTLNDKLGSLRLLGELNSPQGGRAFLFQAPSGPQQTVVFWKQSQAVDRVSREAENVLFRFPASGKVTICDHFGTERTEEVRGTLTLPAERFVTYVSGLSGLRPDKPAYPVRKTENKQPVMDKSIVIAPRITDLCKLSQAKDSIDPGSSDRIRMDLEILNFSDTAKTGTITVQPDDAISGLPGTVTVSPFGKTVLPLTVNPTGHSSLSVRFAGIFNGKPVSPAVVRFRSPERILEKALFIPLERAMEPESWRPSSSGRMSISGKHGNTVRFETIFPPDSKDRWCYPQFLLQLPQETLANTAGLQFEIRTDPGTKIKYAHLFVRQDRLLQLSFPVPTGKWETRTVFFDPVKVKPEAIRELRIGFNPETEKTAFELRNLRAFSY